ncbi:MAG TPA: hypothetical protein VII95_17040 [Terriglobales bacterium]|jgi:hypothetical protein
MARKNDCKAIVFVDDFIGTGGTLEECVRNLTPQVCELLKTTAFSSYVIAVTGFGVGQGRVEAALGAQGLNTGVHVCDPIPGSQMLFCEQSVVFPDLSDRLKAKDIAFEYGNKLLPDAPLGFGDCEAVVVFENKIPNNCLPILWKESKDWQPLFRRT